MAGKKIEEPQRSRGLAMLLTGAVLIAATSAATHYYFVREPEPIYEGFQRRHYHQAIDDRGSHVRFTSTLYPQSLIIDRSDVPARWPSIDEWKEFGRDRPDGAEFHLMPPLTLVWPTPEAQADLRLDQLCDERRPPEQVRDDGPTSGCRWGAFRLSEFSGSTPLQALLTDGRGKLDVVYQTLTSSGQPERNVTQWARFVTRNEGGEQRWAGWICDPDTVARLEARRGIVSPDGKKVMLLDAGNAECHVPEGALSRVFRWRGARYDVHDVALECGIMGCGALFMYGKDLMLVSFAGRSVAAGRGISVADHLRPRYVQAAWQTLERMRRDAREPAQVEARVRERLQWNLDVCQTLLAAHLEARQAQPDRATLPGYHAPREGALRNWRMHDNHCGKAVAAAAVQWHLAADAADKARQLSVIDSIIGQARVLATTYRP